MATLYILDVAHGNCAVLVDERKAIVIDAGSKDTLLDFLEAHEILEIPAVLVSHTDKDHINGLIALFQEEQNKIPVRNVYINPDRAKSTKIWSDFIYVLDERISMGSGTELNLELTIRQPSKFTFGTIEIEILSPSQPWAALGRDRNGNRLRPNTLSAVVRLLKDGHPLVLLAADIDQLVVDEWLRTGQDIRAEILVFPHHGGKPGRGEPAAVARQLCELVKPDTIIFSLGRNAGSIVNPRPDIMNAIRFNFPDAKILCTQLSKNCAAQLPVNLPGHLSAEPALGKLDNTCCAGSISIDLSQAVPSLNPEHSTHIQWLRGNVPKALCMKVGR